MNISPTDLQAEVARARQTWPFIDQTNALAGLPEGLLLAVGSRETNLTDEIGDGGHGHGIWQLDDRSHVVPSPYPVEQQATDAANHLVGAYRTCGTWQGACAAYNSGQCDDRWTTGGDYGADCMDRARWIAFNMPWEDTVTPQDVQAIVDAVTQNVTHLEEDLYNNQYHPILADLQGRLEKIEAKLGVT